MVEFAFGIRHSTFVIWSLMLSYVPSVAGGEKLVQVAFAALVGRLFDLIVDHGIIHRRLDSAEDTDRLGEAVFVSHTAEQVRETRLGRFFVVEQQIVFANAF